MKTKEKAKELVNRCMNINKVKLSDYSVIYTPTAKQCALIAVDLAIEVIYKYSIHSDCSEDASLEYWEEVKEEILKL
jgi:hypothetical protein